LGERTGFSMVDDLGGEMGRLPRQG